MPPPADASPLVTVARASTTAPNEASLETVHPEKRSSQPETHSQRQTSGVERRPVSSQGQKAEARVQSTTHQADAGLVAGAPSQGHQAEPQSVDLQVAGVQAPVGVASVGSTESNTEASTEPAPPDAGLSTGGVTGEPLPWRKPSPITLHFQVEATRKGLSLPASSTLQWASDASGYVAQLHIDAPWGRSRTQTSRGQIDQKWGLRPQRFGDRNRSEQAAHFEWTRQPPVIRFSANTPDAVLTPTTQDRLSVLIQLAGWLTASPRKWSTGDRLTVPVAGARDSQTWTFEWGPLETLDLPSGRVTARHLVRMPTHAYDNRVELWLAPHLDHLPVRVRWTQANGDVVDQRLERTSQP